MDRLVKILLVSMGLNGPLFVFFPNITLGIPLINILIPIALILASILYLKTPIKSIILFSPFFLYVFGKMFVLDNVSTDYLYEILFLSKISLCLAIFMHPVWQTGMRSNKVYIYIEILIISVLLISLIQILLHSYLPKSWYLLPYNLDVDYSRYTRDYNSLSFVRPNGLIGNPIELGSFLLMSIVYFMKISRQNRLLRVLIIGLIFVVIISTLSRLNTMLAGIYIMLNIPIRKLAIYVPIIGILLSSSTLFSGYILLLKERYSGEDLAVQSTLEHWNDYMESIDMILDRPIFGHSLTLIRNEEIITDGALFHLALVFGLVVTLGALILLYRKIGIINFSILILLLVGNSALLTAINVLLFSLIFVHFSHGKFISYSTYT